VVKGVQKFREHFREFTDSFVVIGGVACDEWLRSENLPAFRPTQDIDMVLVLEALRPEFVTRFWEFVNAGKYKVRERSTGERIYYRFSKPAEPDYPAVIEVFSRQPGGIDLAAGQQIVPIKVEDERVSLSAILMNDEYYRLVLDNRKTVDGLPVVTATALIPLKAHAWSDLTKRKAAGEPVDENDIKKHRKDVFRLAAGLPAEPGPEIPVTIRDDLRSFVAAFPANSPEWEDITKSLRSSLGAAVPPPQDLLNALDVYFRLKQ
jgi:hypothetical protein